MVRLQTTARQRRGGSRRNQCGRYFGGTPESRRESRALPDIEAGKFYFKGFSAGSTFSTLSCSSAANLASFSSTAATIAGPKLGSLLSTHSSYLKLIYRSDDVVVDMPVRIGSISPERDDRRKEEQILEHITGALQETIRQPSGAAPCAHRRGRALGLWLPIFAAILTLLVSSATWLPNAR